jgi:hypothetical protein
MIGHEDQTRKNAERRVRSVSGPEYLELRAFRSGLAQRLDLDLHHGQTRQAGSKSGQERYLRAIHRS